ncbi:MAG: GtrA family protein [Gammaproteobacteria bacterium]|nr:GtrA family protein [Gammaproteobacteria bacterium]
MALSNKLLPQLMRFGVIGVSAGIVHFSIVVLLVEGGLLQPLLANIIAFMISFQVSYFGHRLWTFQAETQHRIAFPKLLLVSCTTFMANEGLFYLFMSLFKMPYALALFVVLAILPLFTFTASKLWVFR